MHFLMLEKLYLDNVVFKQKSWGQERQKDCTWLDKATDVAVDHRR